MTFIISLQGFGVLLPANRRLLGIVTGLDINLHLRNWTDSLLYCCVNFITFWVDENSVFVNKFVDHILTILSCSTWSMAYIFCNTSLDLGNYKTFGLPKGQITVPKSCMISHCLIQIIPVVEVETLRYKSVYRYLNYILLHLETKKSLENNKDGWKAWSDSSWHAKNLSFMFIATGDWHGIHNTVENMAYQITPR